MWLDSAGVSDGWSAGGVLVMVKMMKDAEELAPRPTPHNRTCPRLAIP